MQCPLQPSAKLCPDMEQVLIVGCRGSKLAGSLLFEGSQLFQQGSAGLYLYTLSWGDLVIPVFLLLKHLCPLLCCYGFLFDIFLHSVLALHMCERS